ncbi:unnamed protein product, partial [Ectocarpus sp. 12 AP-2014]
GVCLLCSRICRLLFAPSFCRPILVRSSSTLRCLVFRPGLWTSSGVIFVRCAVRGEESTREENESDSPQGMDASMHVCVCGLAMALARLGDAFFILRIYLQQNFLVLFCFLPFPPPCVQEKLKKELIALLLSKSCGGDRCCTRGSP